MDFTNEVKSKYIIANNIVYFKGHPKVEFPKELIELGFKDESWQQDETAFATKKISPDLWVGVWVFNEGDKNTEHRFWVVIIPVDESGDYDPSTAKDFGAADTIEELKNLINKIKMDSKKLAHDLIFNDKCRYCGKEIDKDEGGVCQKCYKKEQKR